MARYIDADEIDYKCIMVGMDENAGYRAVAFESDIDEMPTADVAPKSEVAREIFADLDETLDNITMIISNPAEDNFISVFRKTMEKVTAGVEELKKKYTEEKE